MKKDTKDLVTFAVSTITGLGGVVLTKRLEAAVRPEGKADGLITTLAFKSLETLIFLKVSSESLHAIKAVQAFDEKVKEKEKEFEEDMSEEFKESNDGTE